uniref:Uncharacterized protein n=1 Tax=Serinus canaria TaxID=9135 RepID=A0A8C9L664_SERCA
YYQQFLLEALFFCFCRKVFSLSFSLHSLEPQVKILKMNANDCHDPPKYWTIHGLWYDHR